MPTSQDVLRISIETHNDTFESLLRLIPPKYYLVTGDNADIAVRFRVGNAHLEFVVQLESIM